MKIMDDHAYKLTEPLNIIPVTSDSIPISIAKQKIPSGKNNIILELVMKDLTLRGEFGKQKYGELLTSNNGRDALVDAYQEALDLVMYLRQVIDERDLND